MASRDRADHQSVQDDVEQIDKAIDGGPLTFELGGQQWAIRQPTPVELNRIRLAFDVGRHRAWQELERSELAQTDIESAVANALKMGYLTALREKSEDDDERRAYAEQIEALREGDPTSAFDQMAQAYAVSERDQKAFDLLLDAPDPELRLAFLASPAMIDAARLYVHQALLIASSVPNWQQRQR